MKPQMLVIAMFILGPNIAKNSFSIPYIINRLNYPTINQPYYTIYYIILYNTLNTDVN